MEIRVKLMGMLKPKMPPDGRLTVEDGSTIAQTLDKLDIPADSVLVFSVNGQLVRDRRQTLREGDELIEIEVANDAPLTTPARQALRAVPGVLDVIEE